MDLKAKINKIIKFSNVDGPGNRMAIFFQGCNFNCEYCHNPETINECKNCYKCVEECPTAALYIEGKSVKWKEALCCECDKCIKVCKFNASPKIKEYTVDRLIKEVAKVKPFIKGVTVSGGESTLQYRFITEFFKEIKKNWPNLSCFVDTNGSLNLSDDTYKEFVDITDYFMLDVKAWDEKEHVELTEKKVENVIENLKFLKNIGKLFEVRTVIVNKKLNNELTIRKVSELIKKTDIRYKIIKYRHFGVREELQKNLFSPSDEELKELENLAQSLEVKNTLVI
ncbi:YjjW family glycine radical enzyme activase [Cetobacterium sp.]|uniref:YjjW family glycine radical enzyme activase n=1 Tax=Cetobacterium sp. TaxID=2071632 RepID=UPI003F2AD727